MEPLRMAEALDETLSRSLEHTVFSPASPDLWQEILSLQESQSCQRVLSDFCSWHRGWVVEGALEEEDPAISSVSWFLDEMYLGSHDHLVIRSSQLKSDQEGGTRLVHFPMLTQIRLGVLRQGGSRDTVHRSIQLHMRDASIVRMHIHLDAHARATYYTTRGLYLGV